MGKETSDVIGQRIKETRERSGYTQARLASEADITPAAISQIEAGERTPSTPILRRIASVLKVSSDFLLGTTDDVALKDLLQDDQVQKFFRGFKDLSSKDKALIEHQIEFLKAQKKK